TCEDVGNKHAACSVPWDEQAMIVGNLYQCIKGCFLHFIRYVDELGVERTIESSDYDMKSMKCNKDGWQPEGTPFRGLKVTGLKCGDANFGSSGTSCPSNVTHDRWTLK
ncbi:hypothetical protein PFISCL1PPCAC_4890, partial [Pristionchus fissidentatus]